MNKVYFIAILIWLPNSKAHEFHYGDKVKVYSTIWAKPCFSDEFFNVCDKVGTIIDYKKTSYCDIVYTVSFKFKDAQTITEDFCNVHLRKVRK